jgi:crossover junction endodeoxyribonuclease RuvC
MYFIGVDPSTKTGFVVLDETGEVVHATEIVSKQTEDPARMNEIIVRTCQEINEYYHGNSGVLCIEGFSYGSKGRAVDLQYGLGWCIRIEQYKKGRIYYEVAPAQLKKFTGAKGNAKKDELAVEIYKRWGFEHKSDNVRDAYVLAQIARGIFDMGGLPKFQQDIINKIGV